VQRWYTRHPGASLSFGSGVSMGSSMLTGLVVMMLAFSSYAIAMALARVRRIIDEREAT